MTQKTEQKQRSHDAILESASALLRERGIQASSVGDVMKGAGLTVGGFYNHFDSKEALFTETIRTGARATWQRLVDGVRGATPRGRALGVVRSYLGRRHRDDVAGGCLLPSTAPEVARAGEPYRSALESQLDGFVGSLAGILGSQKEDRQEAIGLIALMYGALSLSRAVADTPLSDELLRAARKLAERVLEADAP
jgi:TetR/AcrR family transcriptional repressor of nem operon